MQYYTAIMTFYDYIVPVEYLLLQVREYLVDSKQVCNNKELRRMDTLSREVTLLKWFCPCLKRGQGYKERICSQREQILS